MSGHLCIKLWNMQYHTD
ncbi:unnamed protein product [Linum tenue]|uniref:Uncharacterized protein n=1 Tax=Linum tenue TaxID=586396 RepID=A0AAV0H929_9ROSI|nr:unnamed protein product [Linum tenue]